MRSAALWPADVQQPESKLSRGCWQTAWGQPGERGVGGLPRKNEKPPFLTFLLASFFQKGKKCSKTKKSPEPVTFTYAGCSSVKKYRPKYCGSCVDGRCCTPQQTRTVKMRFRCEDGETFSKNVMMIQSCKCNYNCPHANEAAFPFYRLFNDIHKFRD